ncbi:MAG: VOC family protein [Planctomycetes bacterium]|nr:VOC family protein [Planctomycetota bacterium]
MAAPCPVCHLEIPAPDPARLAAWYAKHFGWTTTPMGPGYVLFQTSDGELGGGFDGDAKVSDGGPTLVIAVDDLEATLRTLAADGAKTLQGKTDIGGGHGFCAYVRDPAGNRTGLWSKT